MDSRFASKVEAQVPRYIMNLTSEHTIEGSEGSRIKPREDQDNSDKEINSDNSVKGNNSDSSILLDSNCDSEHNISSKNANLTIEVNLGSIMNSMNAKPMRYTVNISMDSNNQGVRTVESEPMGSPEFSISKNSSVPDGLETEKDIVKVEDTDSDVIPDNVSSNEILLDDFTHNEEQDLINAAASDNIPIQDVEHVLSDTVESIDNNPIIVEAVPSNSFECSTVDDDKSFTASNNEDIFFFPATNKKNSKEIQTVGSDQNEETSAIFIPERPLSSSTESRKEQSENLEIVDAENSTEEIQLVETQRDFVEIIALNSHNDNLSSSRINKVSNENAVEIIDLSGDEVQQPKTPAKPREQAKSRKAQNKQKKKTCFNYLQGNCNQSYCQLDHPKIVKPFIMPLSTFGGTKAKKKADLFIVHEKR